MATSDLATELQKDQFRVDSEVERKLCSAIVARLDDSSGDVSSLAVKWYVTPRHACTRPNKAPQGQGTASAEVTHLPFLRAPCGASSGHVHNLAGLPRC